MRKVNALLLALGLGSAAAAALLACSDDKVAPLGDGGRPDAAQARDASTSPDTGSPSGNDAAAPARDAGDASVAADASDAATGGDAADPLPSINGCAVGAYVDQTGPDAGGRVVVWQNPTSGCLRIRAGQSVTWNPAPDSAVHPRAAGGGTTPSPITGAGNAASVAFPSVGTYGWICGNHGSPMQGAIHVVP